jgi:hypothetical protein
MAEERVLGELETGEEGRADQPRGQPDEHGMEERSAQEAQVERRRDHPQRGTDLKRAEDPGSSAVPGSPEESSERSEPRGQLVGLRRFALVTVHAPENTRWRAAEGRRRYPLNT